MQIWSVKIVFTSIAIWKRIVIYYFLTNHITQLYNVVNFRIDILVNNNHIIKKKGLEYFFKGFHFRDYQLNKAFYNWKLFFGSYSNLMFNFKFMVEGLYTKCPLRTFQNNW